MLKQSLLYKKQDHYGKLKGITRYRRIIPFTIKRILLSYCPKPYPFFINPWDWETVSEDSGNKYLGGAPAA